MCYVYIKMFVWFPFQFITHSEYFKGPTLHIDIISMLLGRVSFFPNLSSLYIYKQPSNISLTSRLLGFNYSFPWPVWQSTWNRMKALLSSIDDAQRKRGGERERERESIQAECNKASNERKTGKKKINRWPSWQIDRQRNGQTVK